MWFVRVCVRAGEEDALRKRGALTSLTCPPGDPLAPTCTPRAPAGSLRPSQACGGSRPEEAGGAGGADIVARNLDSARIQVRGP